MDVVTHSTYHLVKSEDLNHHGTLYAGRTAEWFVESGFIAAASITKPENIVCLKVHGMLFSRPVQRGEIVRFDSKIILSGRSKLVAHVVIRANEISVVEGFITFVHVGPDGKSTPHGIEITPASPEDLSLQERARAL